MSNHFDLDQQIQLARSRLAQLRQQAELPTGDRDSLLMEAISELSISLEELHVATEELQQQNDELHATRQDLELERQRYQGLFDFAPDAYLVTDGQGVIQGANCAAQTLFNVRRDLLVGKPLSLFLKADNKTDLYDQLEEMQTMSAEIDRSSSAEPKTIYFWHDQELSLQPRQQEPLPVALSLSGEYDRQGELVRLCWLVRDLRERKQAELTLQQQVQREQLLADIARDIRRSLDLNQVLFRTVERVRQLLDTDRVIIFRFRPDGQGDVIMESVGTDALSILSRTILDPCFSDRYIELYRQGRVSAIADLYTAEIELCYRELLEPFQVRANLVVPILQGEQLWGLLIAHHCSAPRQWETGEIELLQQLANQASIAIQQSELYQKIREQAALIDIATDAICVRNLENRILFWSRGAERLYGWSATAAVGKTTDELFDRESSSEVTEGLNAAIEKGLWQGELEQVTKSGQAIIVASRWNLVRDEFGQPKSILAVSTDITEKKQLEQQFYRTQRLESLGTLAGGIAHDLNNIFAPILMTSQLLPLKLPDLDARTQRLVKNLETSAKRGADLVKQILTFTRGTEGKPIVLQVGHLLNEVEKMARQTFPKSIEIRTDISSRTLWQVKADPTQLHQVFMNLLVNARDAMPHGGTIDISAENRLIDETYAEMNLEAHVGNYIMITVSDTGMGMSPEIVDRIFEPFFTTKEVGKGTGLGLSTVLGIVKNHDGFLQVFSQVGKGTQFQVYLPATEASTIQGTQESELLGGNNELILIVDDEAAVRQITAAALEEHYYQILQAYDGIEAIAIHTRRQHKISVVLLDMMMPNMDGLTAIRRLCAINPRVKIIATSGLPNQRQLAIAAGAKAFLSKPYTIQDLLQTVSELLETS